MSIATEITRLQTAKANLKTSIENKGVTVPSATTLSGYSALVDSIQTGGSSTEYTIIGSDINSVGIVGFDFTNTSISIGDFTPFINCLMWIEFTADTNATIWFDGLDDDDTSITIPSGTKAVASGDDGYGNIYFSFGSGISSLCGFVLAWVYPGDNQILLSTAGEYVTEAWACMPTGYKSTSNGGLFLDIGVASNLTLHILSI